jgi:hypothetical protein
MPFTHYPKLDSNVIFLWRLPIVPNKPAFLGRKHPKNLIEGPLKPGETLVAYHSSQNFTRFYGSIYADVPLEITFTFSNDEYDDNGDFVTDANISKLHYDAEAERKLYTARSNGKFFVTIFGRWLRVEVHYPIKKEFDENEDLQPDPNQKNCEELRLTVRASVF